MEIRFTMEINGTLYKVEAIYIIIRLRMNHGICSYPHTHHQVVLVHQDSREATGFFFFFKANTYPYREFELSKGFKDLQGLVGQTHRFWNEIPFPLSTCSNPQSH